MLSLSGTVSFKNAHDLRARGRIIPPHQLLVETDAPFLTPHPFRGAPNEPYCPALHRACAGRCDRSFVAESGAGIRGENARRVYRLA